MTGLFTAAGEYARVLSSSKTALVNAHPELSNCMKPSRSTSFISLGLAASLLGIRAASATLFFEDGFNYPVGNLAGNGIWTGASGNIQITSPGLALSTLADTSPSGNGVTVTSGVSAGTTKGNFTATPITSGSIYFSFLLECSALPTANNYITALDISGGTPSGSSDPLSIYVGQQVAGSQYKIGVRHTSTGSGATYATTASMTLNSTHFYVAEYTWGGAGGTVSLFVDPTPGAAQPTPDVTVAGAAGSDAANLAVVGFKAQSAATAGNWVFDTVRIGDTWADVTPAAVPEPSTLGLVALGGLGLALWRKRQN